MSELTYDNLLLELTRSVPGVLSDDSSQDATPYSVFDFAVCDFLRSLATKPEQVTNDLTVLFSFFERMASAPDLEVRNVLVVSILEELLSDSAMLHKVWDFMGPTTKEFVVRTAVSQNRQTALPAEGVRMLPTARPWHVNVKLRDV
jgi:hypothetical protein